MFVATVVLILPLLIALALDRALGEAKRFHYLVGFGRLATAVESKLNAINTVQSPQSSEYVVPFSLKHRLLGGLAWALLVMPLPILYTLGMNALSQQGIHWAWFVIADAVIVYLALGLNSLHKHAMQVYRPLKDNQLTEARRFTGYLVSRDTSELSPQQMSRATVESMLENGHDAVIASLVYYLIGGAPLVIMHRLANTLDAMWGYRTPRFNNFGFVSARVDDVLGFVSGKCCALLYALQGNVRQSLSNAHIQGKQYKSHNGGWVMAAGATVMNRTLGGDASYHGQSVTSVTLGCGEAVGVEDIPKSLQLVNRASALLVVCAFMACLVFGTFK